MRSLHSYLKKLTQGILILVLINHNSVLLADDPQKAIITKLIKAYGAETLTTAKSLTINDKYKEIYTGQGASSNFTEVIKNNISLTIDYERKRKSLTAWESSGRGARLTKTILEGSKGRTYDLFNNQFDESNNLTFASLGSNIVRSHDTAIARLVWDSQQAIRYVGEAFYRNTAHNKLTLKTEAGPEITLYIDQKTGLISKVSRPTSNFGELTYAFSNYKVSQGVTFAGDLQVNIAGDPLIISVSRGIDINSSLEAAFTAPLNFDKRGETLDTSKMSVRTLAKNVYFAGQNHTFSLFFDAGEYFFAVGGNAGLKQRFAAVKKKTGVDKPLKYQIVTHHHSDHLRGMNDAAELGANFITVAEHSASVQASLHKKVNADRLLFVDKKAKYANGRVEIYDISSTHSEHNLLVYLPNIKLMFTADHFSTDLKTDLPNADKGTVILRKAIQDLQLDVETFLGAHGARILTNADLQAVADSYSVNQCPAGMTICTE